MSIRSRAVASSMASGMPDSRWHSSASACTRRHVEDQVLGDGLGAVEDEGTGGCGGQVVGGGRLQRWKAEWLDGVLVLDPDAQRRAARDEHGEAGAQRDQLADLRGGAQQVLEVVEHQQRPRVPEVGGDGVEGRRAPWVVRDGEGERAPDRGHQVAGVGERGQRHLDHAVGELRRKGRRRGGGQPRLADAARPDEGDQPGRSRREQRGDRLDVVLAAEEVRGWHHQPARRRLRGRWRARGHGRLRLGRGGGGAPAGDRCEQRRPVLLGGVQGLGERAHRVRVGPGARASLECAHRMRGEGGPLRQLLLGEAGGLAQPPQQHREGLRAVALPPHGESIGGPVQGRSVRRMSVDCAGAAGVLPRRRTSGLSATRQETPCKRRPGCPRAGSTRRGWPCRPGTTCAPSGPPTSTSTCRAVLGSQERLWAMYGGVWGWPPADLTVELHREDLARYEAETRQGVSFRYGLFDAGETEMLGHLTIERTSPTDDAEGGTAEVSWWVVDWLVGGPIDAALDAFVPEWIARRVAVGPSAVRPDLTWTDRMALPDLTEVARHHDDRPERTHDHTHHAETTDVRGVPSRGGGPAGWGWAAAGSAPASPGSSPSSAAAWPTPSTRTTSPGTPPRSPAARPTRRRDPGLPHRARWSRALLLLVFAAGLRRRLAALAPARSSLLPQVAASGLRLVSVAGLLWAPALTTEFVFGVQDPGLLVPETAVFFGHWIGTVPWVWAGAGVAALAVGARRPLVPARACAG